MKTIKLYLVLLALIPMTFLRAQISPDESPCNRHYEAAIKFIVDTPIVHYFSVSKDATTGKEGRVIFSSGNLQYCPSYQHIVPFTNAAGKHGQRCETITDVFRFAPRQIDRVTDGRTTKWSHGNVWYDTIIKAAMLTAGPQGGLDSFYAEKRKCTNMKNAPLCVPNGITNTYHGWIDVFTWGSSCKGDKSKDPFAIQFRPYENSEQNTNNAPNYYGIGPSYYGSPVNTNPEGWRTDVKRNNIDTNSGMSRYFDWGYANTIREYKECTQIVNQEPIHGLDSTCYKPGTWRILTSDEWKYLMTTRKVENSTNSFSYVSVEDTTLIPNVTTDVDLKYIPGLLLYPDDYNYTLVDVPKLTRNSYSLTNRISAADFAKYEAAGCVFLPSVYQNAGTAGASYGNLTQDFDCFYWTATAVNAQNAYAMTNYIGTLNCANSLQKCIAFGVRLVQDL